MVPHECPSMLSITEFIFRNKILDHALASNHHAEQQNRRIFSKASRPSDVSQRHHPSCCVVCGRAPPRPERPAVRTVRCRSSYRRAVVVVGPRSSSPLARSSGLFCGAPLRVGTGSVGPVRSLHHPPPLCGGGRLFSVFFGRRQCRTHCSVPSSSRGYHASSRSG